tara:strand:- start:424 stop:636 length:213 start_codon:yes stop_codon:yes gene_type:complete
VDGRLPDNLPDDCPKIILGLDFYSLALYSFYYNDNEEKDGLIVDKDFDMNKILADKKNLNNPKTEQYILE